MGREQNTVTVLVFESGHGQRPRQSASVLAAATDSERVLRLPAAWPPAWAAAGRQGESAMTYIILLCILESADYIWRRAAHSRARGARGLRPQPEPRRRKLLLAIRRQFRVGAYIIHGYRCCCRYAEAEECARVRASRADVGRSCIATTGTGTLSACRVGSLRSVTFDSSP